MYVYLFANKPRLEVNCLEPDMLFAYITSPIGQF